MSLAACGGSSNQSSASPPTSADPTSTHPTGTPATPAAGSSPLSAYLLRRGDGGFEVDASPVDQTTVGRWVTVSQSTAADGRRVRGEGFRDALQLQTATTTGGGGLDFVLELGSTAAARREEAVELKEDVAEQGHVAVTHFTIAGIPGSEGIAAPGGKQGSAANVLFTEGRCLLLVGDGEVASDYRAQAIAGAQAIYRRSDASDGICAQAGQAG
jgi:hypothetical protein